jgi:hypothetical protein
VTLVTCKRDPGHIPGKRLLVKRVCKLAKARKGERFHRALKQQRRKTILTAPRMRCAT